MINTRNGVLAATLVGALLAIVLVMAPGVARAQSMPACTSASPQVGLVSPGPATGLQVIVPF